MQSEHSERRDRGELTRRVNELYHDYQACAFDKVHKARHNVERVFWQRQVIPRLAAAGCRTGVDLCTGTGFVPRLLLEGLPPVTKILCVDVSEEAIRRAASLLSRHEGRVTFCAGDVEALPLGDETVDWVTLNAGLHHIPEPAMALREVNRILRPGGLFCLGYEPNATFFSSRFVSGVERIIWHAFWYLSLGRNVNRIRQKLFHGVQTQQTTEHLDAINPILMKEGMIRQPLLAEALRRLVDPHAQSDHEENDHHATGFDPKELLRSYLPNYEIEYELQSDYGGEMLRPHRCLRGAYDTLMRAIFPGSGRLFSFVLRKPGGTAPEIGRSAQ